MRNTFESQAANNFLKKEPKSNALDNKDDEKFVRELRKQKNAPKDLQGLDTMVREYVTQQYGAPDNEQDKTYFESKIDGIKANITGAFDAGDYLHQVDALENGEILELDHKVSAEDQDKYKATLKRNENLRNKKLQQEAEDAALGKKISTKGDEWFEGKQAA
ncbi:MAG: hypothetical protein WCW27_06825 [Patescibacteria group bacterium]|jgi:hypothetical protein